MLQVIKRRLEAATNGPWESEMSGTHSGTIATVHLNDGKGWHDIWSRDNYLGEPATQEANAQLIINAPTDIAWLIGEVERLRKIISIQSETLDNVLAQCEGLITVHGK